MNKRKILLILIICLLFIPLHVYANFAIFYSRDYNAVISNVPYDLEKIELFNYTYVDPYDVFEYEIGYVKDEDGFTKNVRLYKTDNYDKEKYILVYLNELSNSITYYDRYYNTEKKEFILIEPINYKEIENFKIKNGQVDFIFKNMNDDYSNNNFALKMYTQDGKEKNIYIEDNAYSDLHERMPKSLLSRNIDYNTGKPVDKDTLIFNFDTIIEIYIRIGLAILNTLIIELIVAAIMKIYQYKLIIIVNIISQLIFHLMYYIPQLFFEKLYGNFLLKIGLLIVFEIIIVISEYLVYRSYAKDYSNKKMLLYSFLSNMASFLISVFYVIYIKYM